MYLIIWGIFLLVALSIPTQSKKSSDSIAMAWALLPPFFFLLFDIRHKRRESKSFQEEKPIFATKKEFSNSLSDVDEMDGYEFEEFCTSLLIKNGFENVRNTKGSGDQGVDIVAEKDGIKYAIQCKCYQSDLGNKPIQEVFTGKNIYRCQVAAVMTNRYFTAGGVEAAEATGVLRWDRKKLQEFIEKAEL